MVALNTTSAHEQKRLQSLMKDSEHLKVDITLRRDLLAKLETESDIVATDLDKAQKQNLKLQTQMDEYTVPSVIDYVVLKVGYFFLTIGVIHLTHKRTGTRIGALKGLTELAT